MSSAFLLCIALQHILPVAGAPTHVPPPNYGSSKLPNILDESPPPIFGNDRSIFDLIWSCLTTVVACSWVSVHPNMPGSNESFARTHIRHLAYLFWAVIAPEAVIFWAAKQWFGARQLANDFKDYGWTMTHGHFLQMGGFVLYENGEETKVVNPEHLRKLLDEGRVEIPKVRKKDIEDRSKASDFGKALVVIQTSWFVVQCITRHVNHLPITKLELVTVALALLNGTMYVSWWHKPFDAQTRIAIHVLPQPESKKSEKQETGSSDL
ncbi:hypothetical protein CPC08DRAFT_650151 [Agrocybe pediades]|nr:hypothetical protein CPC08DRAFT_650151 [Agrocybe pediades]